MKHEHGIGRTEHRDGTGQANLLGAGCTGGQKDGWGGIEIFAAVVLSDAKMIDPHLIGIGYLL